MTEADKIIQKAKFDITMILTDVFLAGKKDLVKTEDLSDYLYGKGVNIMDVIQTCIVEWDKSQQDGTLLQDALRHEALSKGVAEALFKSLKNNGQNKTQEETKKDN